MRTFLTVLLSTFYLLCFSQSYPVCFTNNFPPNPAVGGRSISDKKICRINFHFMLKNDGAGNFTEISDGDGRTTYNGYMFANDITNWMNSANSWNQQMNIPTGNTTPNIAKNYSFVLDACYFWRNDATYNFYSVDYTTQGKDKDSVINIFLSYDPTNGSAGGYASSLDPNSKIKYTENKSYWQGYLGNVNGGYPFGWLLHGTGSNTNHELGHLLGLSHTVR